MSERVFGWSLISITFILVVLGCALFALDQPGWAQLMFVLASGTAGAGVVLVVGGSKHD